MYKPWPITSLRGNAGLSDDSEDPCGDPPTPVADDYPEPDYMALAVRNARAQAAAVTGPQGDQVRECIEAAERAKR
jgi:hypothetical protein